MRRALYGSRRSLQLRAPRYPKRFPNSRLFVTLVQTRGMRSDDLDDNIMRALGTDEYKISERCFLVTQLYPQGDHGLTSRTR